jgi:transmembrane sensor
MADDMHSIDPHVRRITEAASWKARLNDLGLDSSYDFEAWLDEDPANEAAWRQVEAPWDLFGDQAASPRILAARSDALARAHRHYSRRRLPIWVSIAASFLVVGLITTLYFSLSWWGGRPDVYETAHGERRVVVLADGSRVSLDAETELHVRLEDGSRKLELLRGQARFDVAHDARRPFSVEAGDQTIVAIGTSFNIDMLGARPRITLIEGRVEVIPEGPTGNAPARPRKNLTLAAGQQLSFDLRAAPVVTPANIQVTTAWTMGQLIFEDEPLSAVVVRVSRYAERPIVVAPNVASLRVSGVFQSDDAEGFVKTITDFLPVRAVSTPDGKTRIVKAE